MKDNIQLGWISLYRSIKDHWIWSKGPLSEFEAWVLILIECNHQESKVRIGNAIYKCKRGQSVKSILTWSKLFGWTRSKTIRFFILLENDSMIERKSDTKTTQITVCNYDSYQTHRTTNEQQMDIKRTTSEHQTDTNNNVNNDNNIYRRFKHLSITKGQVDKLGQNYSLEQIDEVLDEIENFSGNKKYSSLYLTAKNWLKRKKPIDKKTQDMTDDEFRKFVEGLPTIENLSERETYRYIRITDPEKYERLKAEMS